MPIEQDPAETAAAETELEAMRHHHGHHGHDGDDTPPVTPEERHAAIEKLAYSIWQNGGEQGGHSLDNWLAAESIYDAETVIICGEK